LSSLDSQATAILQASPRSVSMVIGPDGKRINNELCDEEGILYADIDLNSCVEPKQFHDISGGYNRFDVFNLTVNRSAQRPIEFIDGLASDEQQCPPAAELKEESPDRATND